MKKIKLFYLLFSLLLLTFGFSQKAELITQQVNVENAIRGKVENTINKFLDASQYIAIVNARLEFKPLSMGSVEQSSSNLVNQDSSPYTLIPGLDMPSIPTDETIYRSSASGLSGFQYSSSLLYGLEIIIYLDETISTGSLQQNIKTLVEFNGIEILINI